MGLHALEVSRPSGAVSGSSHPVFVRCHIRRARFRLLHGADGGRPGEAHAPLGRAGVDLPGDAGVTRIQRPARTAVRPSGRRVDPGRLWGLTLATGPGTSAGTLPGSLHAVPHLRGDEHRGSDSAVPRGVLGRQTQFRRRPHPHRDLPRRDLDGGLLARYDADPGVRRPPPVVTHLGV